MNKRIKVIAGAAVVGLVGAAGAFAFWSASGAGTGTANTAGDSTPIVVVQTSSIAGLTPAGTPLVLSGNFNNPNTAPVAIPGVTASVASVSPGACAASNYTIAGTATFTANVPVGTGVGSWSGQTIQLKDTGVLQDECKGAIVTLGYKTEKPAVVAPAAGTIVGQTLTLNFTDRTLSTAAVQVYVQDATGGPNAGPISDGAHSNRDFFQNDFGTIAFTQVGVTGITFVPTHVYNVKIQYAVDGTVAFTLPITAI